MMRKIRNRQLEKYLAGELSVLESRKFEEKLKKDRELKYELLLHQAVPAYLTGKMDLDEVISDPDLEQLLHKNIDIREDKTQEYHEDIIKYINSSRAKTKDQSVNSSSAPNNMAFVRPSNQTMSRILVISFSSIAAAFMLFFVFFGRPGRLQGEKVFDHQYSQFVILSHNFRGGDVDDLMFKSGIKAYKEGNYQDAIDNFSKIDSEGLHYDHACFYLPMSYLGIRDFEKAIQLLEIYLKRHGNYKFEAQWYLSLCYLKQDDFIKAEKVLIGLVEVESIYRDPALILMKRIKRMRK